MGKKIKKLIPKEIAPAAPFIAAYFGGPALGKALFSPASGVLSSAQLATAKGLTAALASKATGADTKSAIRSGFLAAAPDVVGGQLMKADPKFLGGSKFSDVLYKTGEGIKNAGALKTIGVQSSIEGAQQLKEMNEKALRDYEASLREQGIMDSAERRNKIFGYFSNAGYDTNEVNAFLDKYGYKYGGRVGYKKAGLVTLDDLINKTPSGELFMSQFKNEDEDEDEDEYKPRPKFSTKDLMSGLDYASKGLETAFGRPIDMRPERTRFGLAEGGITSTEEAKVYMTDDNSGVIYRDPEGKPITKEEFFKGTDEAEREGKAMGGIMKKVGKELMKRIVQPAKRKIGQMTDDVEIDVNYDADIYDDGTAYGITEINILPKTKKGKEALDQAVKEGSAEMSSDGSYFVKQPEEVSGLLYEKGIKVSGVNKPQMNRFERFDEGAKYDDSGYNIPDYEIEMFEDLARKRKADGGIMNVSDLNNERFLEQRAEQYMEEGFSPEDAMDKALDDLKNNRFPALKDGGMMNLGGREMDMRGGGFIPIGAKERADDVPARLSKNEFVMTADAVRGAGNGDTRKGARKMYQIMNNYEAKV
jgi:hypothetical protein